MKLTKEKLQQIIKEELETLMQEAEDFPHDLWKEFKTLKNRAPLFNLMRDMGDEFASLLALKDKFADTQKLEGTVEDEDGAMQNRSWIEGNKVRAEAEELLNNLGIKHARSVVFDFLRNEGEYYFREDPLVMKARYEDLRNQFKTDVKRDERAGIYVTTIVHIPSGTSTTEESGMRRYGS
tara:strand:+ start:1733 stop:2272 length:540 start_codon:yes stop_codon:yes gene_type:complete